MSNGSLILSRRDLDFLLYEWLGVEQLCSRPRFADHSRETFDAALDIYEQIAAEKFAPHNKKNDQQEPQFDGERVSVNPEVKDALDAFSAAGLMAASQDYELGGMQLPMTVALAGMGFMTAANAGTTAYPFLTMANANLLKTYATAEQIDAYVRPMMTGRYTGTMCLSEPQAGSSLADIRTRAEPQDDGSYRLFGNKMWISAGEHELSENIIHLVLAKIPDAGGKLPDGVQGISLFLVPKHVVQGPAAGERNDVVLAGLNHKMGYRGTTNTLLNFGEGKHLPGSRAGAIGYLVGEPGKGLASMFHMMNEARINVGHGAAVLGYTGYLHALDYAKSRTQGRRLGNKDPASAQVRLIEHADVRRMLLAQKAYVEGGVALTLLCAKLVDDEATHDVPERRREAALVLDLLTPIAKSWPSQWCLAANDLAIQVHGGYGYTRDYNVEQFYRDNRLNPIHEGTHGIQAIDLLGRKVRLHAGAGLEALGTLIAHAVSRAQETENLATHAVALGAAWGKTLKTTESLLAEPNGEIRLANASAYLEAFGHVVVAWLWLEQALIATMNMTSESDFYQGKLQACRYFFAWELPKIDAMLSVLSPVETSCLDMRENWF
jgi:alkylation response protein AidB-like acyl-CoA dehydrogenase